MSLRDALSRFGNYLVQSEVDAGVRDPITKDFYSPVSGAQTGFFGPDVSSKSVLDDFSSARSLKDMPSSDDPPPSGGRSFVSRPAIPEYINAEFAKIYGMDLATAYQEALANTAHQREVQDLKAAGLNPVLSTRYGGASGVSGAQVLSSVSSRGSSGSSEDSTSPLKLISGLAILAGTVAGIATKRPSIGYAVNSAVTSLSKVLDF